MAQVKIVLLEEALVWLLVGYIELGSLVLLISLVLPHMVGAGLAPALVAPGESLVKDLMLQRAEG